MIDWTWAFVTARIFANPVSNVFQKQLTQRAAHPISVIAVTHALLAAVCLPLLLLVRHVTLEEGFWPNMITCAVLAVASNVLLVYALRWSDLSVLGPINAYKPVVSVVLAVFLLGELPSATGALGIVLIVAGSYFIFDRGGPLRDVGVQLRFAALVLSATEAVFLKRALLLSSPLTTFLYWSILGFPFAAVFARRPAAVLRNNWRTCVWLALATGIMQSTTLFTFGRLQVGYSLALFQLSALISVFLGYRLFQEKNVRRRAIGCLVMVVGAALIVSSGG